MKVYVRKIDEQCVTHQIGTRKVVLEDFFDNALEFIAIGVKSGYSEKVRILTSTDYRFDAGLSHVLAREGKFEIGDIIVFYKENAKYEVELVKPNDSKYNFLKELCERDERHTLIEVESYIKDNEKSLRDFYIENLKNNLFIEKESERRKKFVDEYPLDRLLTLTKEEYCLGLNNNQESLCYKLEFGEYKDTGFSIGGVPSGKYGFYYSNADRVYKGKNNKIIENPDEYWNSFRMELYQFLKEMETAEPTFVLNEKYPLLGGSGSYMFLTKLLCLYYPNRFIAIANTDVYKKLADYLNIKLNDNSIYNSYFANISFRKYVPEANNHDAYYIANAIWKFFGGKDQNNEENAEERVIGAFNKIYYGVPGSGKSYYVNEIFNETEYKVIRTTFHPEYTNADFIGQIIPKLHKLDDNTSAVSYDFNEGAFAKALKYALSHSSEKVVLIIEEINRGNAAAIFGDIFQLLDRDEKGNSKYAINNEILIDYLNSDKGYDFALEKIIVPSNLWIIGTMNTSDQNVFALDTAFKRRWKMEYIPNVFDNNDYSDKLRKAKIPRTDITWEQFVTEINNKMINDDSTMNSEDKQLGVYFVTLDELNNEKEFAEKVLSYLWDDVAKINSEDWFGSIKTYDELVDAYDKESLKIFNNLFENYQIHLEENNNE